MTPTGLAFDHTEPLHYQLVVEGELAQDWAEWFGAAAITAAEGRTVIDVAVPDQSALHGVLSRVNDLNLRLISLTRTETD